MRTSIPEARVHGHPRAAKANLLRRGGQTAVAWTAIAASVLGLAACSPEKPAQGVVGYVSGFAGFVSAEEPRAAVIGEETLSAGGTAADAAVAMAATLTVTMPSRAGWMGGGVCLARQPKDKSVEVYAFMPEALPGGGFAPGMPRGLYALHASSGVLRWETILTPAENIARFGQPVSRAFARDLQTLGTPTALGANVRSAFTRPDGTLLREGDNILQLRTAGVLTSLRIKGAGDAYSGGIGNLIAQANPDRAEDRRAALRAYTVKKVEPITIDVENETAFFPPAPFAGAQAAAVWAAAAKAEQVAPTRAVAPAPAADGVTGFAVVDRGGMAVTCALTMGQLFGAGAADGPTGMLAYSPLGGDADARAMMPMIVSNKYVKDLRIAAVGAGSTAIADVLDFAVRGRVLKEKAQTTSEAIARAGAPGSRVTGVICPDGAPANVANCTLADDPRGAGMSRAVGIDKSESALGALIR